MEKILKIIPYYGKFPKMWLFYLDSLRRHTFIDVLLVTDIEQKIELPSNIKVLKMTLDQLYNLAEDKLDCKITARTPYKLCDIKPALGVIFQEHTKDYKYWAYGDIDLIYGNLERFLKTPIEQEYDVITFREEWYSGAFTIIKNIPVLNNLALQSPDFIKVLNNIKPFCFDECGRKYQSLREGLTAEEALKLNIPGDVVCWTTLINRLLKDRKIKVFVRNYIKESLPFGEIIEFRDGKIIGSGYTEYPIYHFVWHKKQKCHIIPTWSKIPNFYFLSPTGIYKKEQLKFYFFISNYRKLKGKLLTYKQKIIDSYNYRLRKRLC